MGFLRTVILSAMLVGVMPSLAMAQSMADTSKTIPEMLFERPVSQTAHELIEDYAAQILTVIDEGREGFEKHPEALTSTLTTLLESVVDFESISKAVMGKHRKAATDEQKEAFVKVFKYTMVSLYTKAMLGLGVEKVVVLEDQNKHPSLTKAKVIMEVSAPDETSYSVIYTMRKSKQKGWRVRNMILDGINLGLTYLNQFDSAMNRYDGDVDKVLDTWGAEESAEEQE